MIDFYLNQGAAVHECRFPKNGVLDFLPPADFPYHNWRAVLHKGNHLLATGDVITLTPVTMDTCRLSIRSETGYEKHCVDLKLGRPSYPHAAPEPHWLEGKLGDASIFIYLWVDGDNSAILLQRFVDGGGSEAHLPTRPGVVSYKRVESAVIPPEFTRDAPEGAPDQAFGTQEDEGGGYIP